MGFPLQGDTFRKTNSFGEFLKPAALDDPVMKIKIAAGWVLVNGTTYIEYAGGYSPTITAPLSNTKYVLVYLDSDGYIKNVDGTASATPVFPDCPKTGVAIAMIKVPAGTSKITNLLICDARPLFAIAGYPTDHDELNNKDAVDQHPIAAITGLQDALDAKVASSALTTTLLTKADATGTTEATFKINKDSTGVPSEDIYILSERGDEADVGFKWNETADRWALTNNGSDYYNICDTRGTDLTSFILNILQTGTPDEDVSLMIERGDSTNTGLKWNETTDKWQFTNNGTNWYNIASEDAVALKASLTGAADIEITDTAKGLILTASDSSRHRLKVGTDGALTTEVVS